MRARCINPSVDLLINLLSEGSQEKKESWIYFLALLLLVTIFSLKSSSLAFPYIEVTLKLKARYWGSKLLCASIQKYVFPLPTPSPVCQLCSSNCLILFAIANWPGRDTKWLKIASFPWCVHIDKGHRTEKQGRVQTCGSCQPAGSQKNGTCRCWLLNCKQFFDNQQSEYWMLAASQNAGAGLACIRGNTDI